MPLVDFVPHITSQLVNIFYIRSMNIIVLSRNASLYSTDSIVRAARRRHHYVRVLDHMQCDLVIEQGKLELYYNHQRIQHVDAVIPRIGSSATTYGAAVIRQFEAMGIFTALGSEPLLRSRDKLSSLQILSANGIKVPRTAITNNSYANGQMLEVVSQGPYVLKLASGTHGIGVILSPDKSNAESILEAFSKSSERVLIQKFIPEVKGSDVRVFIVDGEIVGVMKRQAAEGEFRSNLHRGGSSFVIKLTREEEQTALKSAELMGLKVAGVDMLQSNDGPMVLEVNASPGLEGIEGTTQVDIAGKIIQYLERNVKHYR